VGWFDAVLARYACRVNTFTSVAITKLDTLDQFDAISICTAYRHRGTRELVRDISYVTASVLEDYEPVLETLAGWQASTHGASEWQELPQGARDYVDAIARELSTPVAIVSTGPGREHSIVLNDLWSPQA
jgi:adenylosuccinate synthase